jgi:hypothetical protein
MQTLLNNLKERHGVEIELTKDIEALIHYVQHISYAEGWNDAQFGRMPKVYQEDNKEWE